METQAGTTCGIAPGTPQPPAPPAPPAPLPPAPPAPPGSPNIVFFLTDDQDQKLGGSFPMHNGVGPMPKTKAVLADKGATGTHATPVARLRAWVCSKTLIGGAAAMPTGANLVRFQQPPRAAPTLMHCARAYPKIPHIPHPSTCSLMYSTSQ